MKSNSHSTSNSNWNEMNQLQLQLQLTPMLGIILGSGVGMGYTDNDFTIHGIA